MPQRCLPSTQPSPHAQEVQGGRLLAPSLLFFLWDAGREERQGQRGLQRHEWSPGASLGPAVVPGLCGRVKERWGRQPRGLEPSPGPTLPGAKAWGDGTGSASNGVQRSRRGHLPAATASGRAPGSPPRPGLCQHRGAGDGRSGAGVRVPTDPEQKPVPAGGERAKPPQELSWERAPGAGHPPRCQGWGRGAPWHGQKTPETEGKNPVPWGRLKAEMNGLRVSKAGAPGWLLWRGGSALGVAAVPPSRVPAAGSGDVPRQPWGCQPGTAGSLPVRPTARRAAGLPQKAASSRGPQWGETRGDLGREPPVPLQSFGNGKRLGKRGVARTPRCRALLTSIPSPAGIRPQSIRELRARARRRQQSCFSSRSCNQRGN